MFLTDYLYLEACNLLIVRDLREVFARTSCHVRRTHDVDVKAGFSSVTGIGVENTLSSSSGLIELYPGILCHFPPLFVTNWFSRVTTTLIAAFTWTPQPQGDQLVEWIVSQNTYPNRWTSLTPTILPLSGTLKLLHYASLEQKHTEDYLPL